MKKIKRQISGIWLILFLIFAWITWIFPGEEVIPIPARIGFYIILVFSGLLVLME